MPGPTDNTAKSDDRRASPARGGFLEHGPVAFFVEPIDPHIGDSSSRCATPEVVGVDAADGPESVMDPMGRPHV